MSLCYDKDNLPRAGWSRYQKRTMTEAVRMPEDFQCWTIDGNLAEGKAGDYLMVDGEGFPYPCARRIFEVSYMSVDV